MRAQVTKTLQQTQAELAATQHELDLLGEYFLMSLDKLPRKELKVSLTEQAQLGKVPLVLQARADGKGNVFFRAVKSFN